MSNNKHFADLLKVCSILPALLVMPAMASNDPFLSGNAFVLGDVVTNNTIFGGVRIVSASPQTLAWPEYKMVARSFELNDINGGKKVYFGPIDLTVRELDDNEEFTWNSQRYDESGNPIDFDLAKYNTDGSERENKVVWNNANGVEELGAMDRFLTRDDSKEAGKVNVTSSDVVMAGSKIVADEIVFSKSSLNIVKDQEASGITSDGVAEIFANKLLVKDDSKIVVGADASLVLKDDVLFKNNTAGEHGGAIYNNGTLDLSNATAEFKENSATQYGGAIYNSGTFVLNNAKFHDNTAEVGGAFFVASGSDMTISNSEFAENFATYGGVGYTSSKLNNLTIVDSVLRDNTATGVAGLGLFNQAKLERVDFERNISSGDNSQGGGAVFLGSEAKIDIVEGTFVGNEVKTNGGAIGMRTGGQGGNNSAATLSITGTEFSTNFAANGGAIYNTFYNDADNSGAVSVSSATFANNIASVNGGAVYNDGSGDTIGNVAVMHFDNNVTFSGNEAGNNGGAIYNTGTIDLSKAVAEFDGNIASLEGGAIYNQGDMKIAKAEFENNKASVYGGAISNRATMTIQDAKFKENISYGNFGGALYNAKSGNIETLDADFSGNKIVNEGSAAGGAISNIGKIGELTGMFDKNVAQATGSSAKGGAIHTYAGSYVDSVVADFTGNSAVSSENEAIGGAIVNDGNIGTLHQAGSGFVNNSVSAKTNGWAGALYNSETGVISELVANFTGNSVQGTDWALGGALVNKGTIESMSGVFANNSVVATSEEGYSLGGAIYNGVDATINFDGDVLFSNNTALEGADIYNDGIVNIVSGTTTIDTAVAGEGTLNVASDAILNIGTATVQQTQINIDGIVQASVLSDRSYGRLLGLIEAKDSAELKLNVGSVGSYKIFDSQADITVTAGATYDVSQEEDGTVVIATKAVEDIATGAGISTQAAGAVAGLANADSGKVQQVSLALQEALNSGDAEFVEKETKKLNPTDKPIAQAAATSVQNQVLSLAAGRMSGGAVMGRAGGDEIAQENGFWVQGLFNKSKFADEFHGYTRGVALGADTTIDKTWTVGAGLAFNNSDVHADAGHTDIDSKTLFVYGQYKPSNWFVNGTATYTMSEYTEDRKSGGVMWNNEYDVNSYGAQIMTGYDFATGITTEAGLRYLHIAQDGYTDGLNFGKIKSSDTDFLTGVAGVKYAFAIENDWAIKLRPELRAALTYDMISDDASATVVMPGVASYKVDSESLSRMGGEFGIGLTADYKGIKVSLMYDLNLHKDYTSQTGMIKFRSQF